MHTLGVAVGILGIRAVALRSRGSSRNFFILLVLFVVVYFCTQAFYLYDITKEDSDTVLNRIFDASEIMSVAVYFQLLTSFGLVFVCVKAFRFHILLSILIENQKSQATRPGLGSIQELN